MQVMFSGFDDGGWWLVLLGCRKGSEVTEPSRKTGRKTARQWLELLPWGGERREKMKFLG